MSNNKVEHASPYPPVRRVVTGHDASGKSVFVEDKPITGIKLAANTDSEYVGYGLYRHDEFPASNQDGEGGGFVDHIASKPTEIFPSGGTTFWAIDTPPHTQSRFHRTITLDYAIVTKGTITLILEDGERVKASAGDVVIQRGTIHELWNEGDEWTRVFYVVIPAEKIKVGEVELDAELR